MSSYLTENNDLFITLFLDGKYTIILVYDFWQSLEIKNTLEKYGTSIIVEEYSVWLFHMNTTSKLDGKFTFCIKNKYPIHIYTGPIFGIYPSISKQMLKRKCVYTNYKHPDFRIQHNKIYSQQKNPIVHPSLASLNAKRLIFVQEVETSDRLSINTDEYPPLGIPLLPDTEDIQSIMLYLMRLELDILNYLHVPPMSCTYEKQFDLNKIPNRFVAAEKK